MLKDNLKVLREAKGLTKKQVAQGVGINERAYIAYEYGERDVSTETLCKLADFYGVSTDYLLGRTPVKRMATEETDPFANVDVAELEKRIIEKYTALSEEMRAFCIDIFRQQTGVIITPNGEVQHESQRPDIEIFQNPQPFVKIARNGKRTILSDEEVEKLHALDDDEPPNLN